MDFIIINTDLLTENSLEYKQTYAGQDIAIPDLQDTHYDIIGITIEKLVNCTKVYQRIGSRIQMEKHTLFVMLPAK